MNWKDFIVELENGLFGERFSDAELANKIGVDRVTIWQIRNGKKQYIQQNTKGKFEKAFSIRINDDDFENLQIIQRTDLPSNHELTSTKSRIEVRGNYLLGAVSAGRAQLLDYEDKAIEDIDYPIDTCFWYSIDKQNGDSMYPLLCENDKVLIDRNLSKRSIKEMDIVVVFWGNSYAAVKLFGRSETDANILVFHSANIMVPPIILHKDKCEYFKVVLIKKV
ncbi:MAG: S24 family peptidase [Bacteroidetes bacterium]|nr:S24 family peptidase [Bacteroidota bacterium]